MPDFEELWKKTTEEPGVDFESLWNKATFPSSEKVALGAGVNPASAGKAPFVPGLSDSRTAPARFTMDRMGRRVKLPEFGEEGADPLRVLSMPVTGLQKVGEGIATMSAPGVDPKLAGTSQVIRGLGEASAPFFIPGAVMNPALTAGAVTGGTIGSGLANVGMQAIGASPGATELATDIGGIIGGAKGAKAGQKVKDFVGTIENTRVFDPTVSLVKSLNFRPNNPADYDAVPQTMSAIRASADRPITNVETLIQASNRAINNASTAFNKWMDNGRRLNMQISGDPIAARVQSSLPPSMANENPQAAAALSAEMGSAYRGKRYTVDQLRALLVERNKELSSFFRGQVPDRYAKLNTTNAQGMLTAERDAIADTLYSMLDPDNAGAGPRAIQQATGRMIEIRNQAQRRLSSAIAQRPTSKVSAVMQDIQNKLGIARNVMTKNVMGLLEETPTNIDYLVEQGFKAVPVAPPVYPQPRDVKIAGLLPKPAIRVPGAPDISGIDRPGTQLLQQQFEGVRTPGGKVSQAPQPFRLGFDPALQQQQQFEPVSLKSYLRTITPAEEQVPVSADVTNLYATSVPPMVQGPSMAPMPLSSYLSTVKPELKITPVPQVTGRQKLLTQAPSFPITPQERQAGLRAFAKLVGLDKPQTKKDFDELNQGLLSLQRTDPNIVSTLFSPLTTGKQLPKDFVTLTDKMAYQLQQAPSGTLSDFPLPVAPVVRPKPNLLGTDVYTSKELKREVTRPSQETIQAAKRFFKRQAEQEEEGIESTVPPEPIPPVEAKPKSKPKTKK